MSAEALIAFADEALVGLAHRRVDFDHIDAAESLRADFEAKGWKASCLLWMRHEGPAPPGPAIAVDEVPYDAVHDLRTPGTARTSRTRTPPSTTHRPARSRCVAACGC